MNRIAIISDSLFVYWTPIILTLAAVAALSVYACAYLLKGGKGMALFVSFPLCIFLGIVLGRFVHWYCRPGVYSSFSAAMTDFSQGDYALVGVFAACMLTACLLRLIRLSDNLPKMLDAMALGGGVGIAVGRLAPLFNSTSRGLVLPDHVSFPFSYPLTNAVSGAMENRLATFMFQSFFSAVITLSLIAYVIVSHLRKKKIKDGDIFLIFLVAHCCSQILCDSMRNDALVLRSNGFVSMVQIVGAVGLVFSLVIFSIRMVKGSGLKVYHFLLWVGILGMLGLAGYMEYFVQNNGTKSLFAYITMGSALAVVVLLTLIVRLLGNKKVKAKPIPEEITEQEPVAIAE